MHQWADWETNFSALDEKGRGSCEVKKGHIFVRGLSLFFHRRREIPPLRAFQLSPVSNLSKPPHTTPYFNFYFILCVVVVGGPITELCAFFFFLQISFCQVCHFFVYFAAPFLFPVWGLASLQIQSEQQLSTRYRSVLVCVKVWCPSQLKLGPPKVVKLPKVFFIFSSFSVAVINNSEKPGQITSHTHKPKRKRRTERN